MKAYPGRFAAIYALLAICLIGIIPGTIALGLAHSTRAKIAHVQEQLGDTNLTRLADKAITDAAQSQGLGVRKIVVRSVVSHGNAATVVARVTVTDGITEQTVDLRVTFQRGVWAVSNIGVQ